MNVLSKTSLLSLFVLLMMCISTTDLNAQRRKRKKRETKKTEQRGEGYVPFKDKLTYEIGIGNISFFNNNFTLGIRPAAAYKVNKFLNIGLGGKYIFNYFNLGFGNEVTTHTYGVFPYTQVKLGQSFYLKGLYEYGHYEEAFSNGATVPYNEFVPMFGGGYTSGLGQWKWGIEILWISNQTVRTVYQPVEYFAVVSYNF